MTRPCRPVHLSAAVWLALLGGGGAMAGETPGGITAKGPAAAEAKPATDRVLLTNGFRMDGTIEIQQGGLAVVRNSFGTMAIPAHMVASLQLAYDSRRKALNPEDYRALMDLARWCLAEGRRAESLELLEIAVAHPRCDAEALRLLAQLVDDAGGGGEAATRRVIELYRRYRDEFQGRDQESLQRLALLEEHVARLAAVRSAIAERRVVEGLEAQIQGWARESAEYFNPTTLAVEQQADAGSATNAVLRLTVASGAKDKGAVRRRAEFAASATPLIVFQAANLGKRPVSIAIAVKTGRGYIYHESPAQPVPGGGAWTDLRFDLEERNFKSQASGWAPNVPLADPDEIREFLVLIYNGHEQTQILVDNLGYGARGP
jgi:hypothetical protein